MIPGRIFMIAHLAQQPAQAAWDGFCMLINVLQALRTFLNILLSQGQEGDQLRYELASAWMTVRS